MDTLHIIDDSGATAPLRDQLAAEFAQDRFVSPGEAAHGRA